MDNWNDIATTLILFMCMRSFKLSDEVHAIRGKLDIIIQKFIPDNDNQKTKGE